MTLGLGSGSGLGLGSGVGAGAEAGAGVRVGAGVEVGAGAGTGAGAGAAHKPGRGWVVAKRAIAATRFASVPPSTAPPRASRMMTPPPANPSPPPTPPPLPLSPGSMGRASPPPGVTPTLTPIAALQERQTKVHEVLAQLIALQPSESLAAVAQQLEDAESRAAEYKAKLETALQTAQIHSTARQEEESLWVSARAAAVEDVIAAAVAEETGRCEQEGNEHLQALEAEHARVVSELKGTSVRLLQQKQAAEQALDKLELQSKETQALVESKRQESEARHEKQLAELEKASRTIWEKKQQATEAEAKQMRVVGYNLMKKSEADKAHIEELLTQLEAATERLELMDKRAKASEQAATVGRPLDTLARALNLTDPADPTQRTFPTDDPFGLSDYLTPSLPTRVPPPPTNAHRRRRESERSAPSKKPERRSRR